MTIGTSAPPTGSTSSTPTQQAEQPRRTHADVADVSAPSSATTQTDSDHRADQRRRRRAPAVPGKITGRVVISSCSLAKVTTEPAKETEPTTIVNAARRAGTPPSGRRRSRSSSSATSAAAPPPTPLNSATSCGICGHLHRAGAVDAARRCRPRSRRGSAARGRGRAQKNVARRASTAPKAPIRLPLRAVFGDGQALEREDEADRRDQVDQLRPRSASRVASRVGPSRLAAGFLRGTSRSIRSVTTKPPTMFTVASTIATSPSDQRDVALGLAGDEDRAEQDHAVDGVGAGHQRRVQRRGDLGDDLDADEDAEHEDRQPDDIAHAVTSPTPSRTVAVVGDPARRRRSRPRSRARRRPSFGHQHQQVDDVLGVEPAGVDRASATARSGRPTPWRCRSTTSSPATDALDVAAGLGGQVDDHRAGLHRLDHRAGDQQRRRPARDRGGRDQRVGGGDVRRQQLALAGRPGPRSSPGRSRRRPRASRARARRTWRPSTGSPRPRPARTSYALTTAPSRLDVAIACSPATPAPSTRTSAGWTVPAAVMISGKNGGSRSAATIAQR